jgi:hypothetical protein
VKRKPLQFCVVQKSLQESETKEFTYRGVSPRNQESPQEIEGTEGCGVLSAEKKKRQETCRFPGNILPSAYYARRVNDCQEKRTESPLW